MKFCWTTIYVKNMEDSLNFYHGVLGLEIAEKFCLGKEMEIAMLGGKDEPKIELICDEKTIQKSTGLSIGFEVDSIEKALELMNEKKVKITKGPFAPIPSSKFFFIDDPDGVEIQIVYHGDVNN